MFESYYNNALFGYTGFVGSALNSMYNFEYLYNSKNINEAISKNFDNIIISCIPAIKWFSNKYPHEDNKAINNIKNVINTINANNVILISTIDVYNNTSLELDESSEIDYENNHTYGKNRMLFEKYINDKFKSVYIFRLPALYGNGLKKNILYDLLNNNEIYKININSYFQWYNINWLKEDIDNCIRNKIKCCNLFTTPINTKEIIDLFTEYNKTDFREDKKVEYNCKTIYYNYFKDGDNGYIRSKETVLNDLKKYISVYNKKPLYDLCVSNISCGNNMNIKQLYNIMKYYSINNIEVAPTKYGNWDKIFENKDMLVENIANNLNIYSLQSITYNITKNIFNEEEINDITEHIKKVIDYALYNNIKILVFGSPNNRKINGNMERKHCDNIFIKFMRLLGDYIGNNNITICIENNSKLYNCNYLNNIREVGDIVNEINHKNIKQVIDIGNCIMENDNIEDIVIYKKNIKHIHVSSPYLSDILYYNKYIINKLVSILEIINYKNKITLEIANIDDINILANCIEKFKSMFISY